MDEHQINLAEVVDPKGSGTIISGITACTFPGGSFRFSGQVIIVPCTPECLPDEGFMVAGTWIVHDDRDNHRPFVVQIGQNQDSHRLYPSPCWEFETGCNGGLLSANYPGYKIDPSDPGYFECFLRSNFSMLDHLKHLADLACVSDLDLRGHFQPHEEKFLIMLNRLMIQTVKTLKERDEARDQVAKREGRGLETMAWLDELLRKGETAPLDILTRDRDGKIAGLARQAAGIALNAREALHIPRQDAHNMHSITVDLRQRLPATPFMVLYRPDLV